MVRVHRVRGIAICAFLLLATSAFAATYTSTQSGDWNQTATWGGAGTPGSGDDAIITSNHVVTVTGAEVALSVTLDSTAGNKMLVIDSGGSLLVELAAGNAITVNAPSPGSTNIVRLNGGTLETSNSGISITGGASDASKLEFTTLGGTATFFGDVIFAGTAANAQIDFGPTSGILEIGGDLGSGGTIVTNTNALVEINGTGAQTINSYTFHHFEIDKSGGTATLNGPITVNGDLTITAGVLDDGGNQISLNGGGTSNVTVNSMGVLKLGSAGSATFFPTPLGSATMNGGSAVVYQSGLQQTIDSAVAYDRLYLATLGGAVSHIQSGASLTVNNQLDITDNGVNTVTFDLGTGTLDLNGDLTGDGTLSMTSGSMTIAGSFSSSASLNAGTGTVTYDGGSAQSVLGATYFNLVINKSASAATLGGSMAAEDLTISSGIFDAGVNTITLTGDFSMSASGAINASSASLVLNGSVQQQLNATAPVTFGSVDLNNTSGAVLNGFPLTVTGTMSLDGGLLAGEVFVDVLATFNRTSGWIVGDLSIGLNPTPARRFHVGTASAYLPVDVDAGSAGFLTIRAIEGQSPDRTANNVLDRYWTISGGSVTPIDSITFNYNQSDVVTGDETKYILASYDSDTFTFTHYGDVNDAANTATATNVTSYVDDWIIGQPGSLAAASKLAITSVNSGSDPQAATAFDVVVEAQDDDGDATPVFDPTGIALSVAVGTGTLGGTTTGTIAGGTDTITISGVTYSLAETGVELTASRTSGDVLDSGTSAPFDVQAAPSTLTVTNTNDSGTGSLREAIATANSGGCTAPCTIEFSTSGVINAATPLPAIVVSDLTIDGYTAPGASANTNAFGSPSNAVITLTLNGGGSVNFGFDIQETFVKVTGFSIMGFTNAGVRLTGDNSGSNVSGCYIGTDPTGTTAGANAGGVLFDSSTESSAGGTLPAARNVISGNTFWGITVSGTSNTISLAGNYVGPRADLAGALPNVDGIVVQSGVSSVSIGSSGVGNVVSGNSATGVILGGSGATLAANFIGTAGDTNTALANSTGVYINATGSNNTIGGASPSDENVISGNTQNGILIAGDSNTVDNNLIGIAPDGTANLANGGSGIRLENTASDNFLGTSFGNKIAYNTNDGVTVTGTGIGNVIRRGKIAGNSNRGIDLADDGTTSNDATDADTGANNLQNFPTITEAKYNAGNVDLKLSLDSSGGVSANFVVFDVYKADGSSPAQAIEYLGNSGCLAGNVFTNQLVSVTAGTAVVGSNVVATATAYSDAACTTPSEGTSEFSASARIGGDIHWIAGTGNWETAANWNPATVPTSADNAYIDNVGTYTVTINSLANVASVHVGAASGTQTLTVGTSQSLNLSSGASTVSANGVLIMNGIGINAASSALTVSGTFNWNIGSLTGAGGVTLASGATMNIDTASGKTINAGSLTVGSGASVNWLAGPINVQNAGFIDNLGLFEIKTDNTIADAGSAGTFDNAGTLRKSTTAGSTNFTNLTLNHTAGTIDIQTGTLNLAGGTASSPITISSGATLLIDSDIYTLGTGANVTGLGKVHINGGTLAVNGSPHVIEHLQLDAGTLGGTGNVVTGANSWQWNGGTMSGGGTTTIESGGSLVIGTATGKALDNRTLATQSSSTTTVTGSGTINFANGGNLNNGGLFDTTVDVALADSGSDGGILNTGTFRKSGGAGSTAITNVDFTNNGTIDIDTGTFNPGNVTSTGTIDLTGTFLVNDGIVTLSPNSDVTGPGLLQIAGGTVTANYVDTIPNVQLDSGTLDGTANIDIPALTWNGGTMSGAGTTTIPAGGTATIATASGKSLQRTFAVINGGTVNVTGSGAINLSSGGNITNDGLIDVSAAVAFNDAGSAGDIANTRTFRSNHAGTTTLAGITLNSSGASGLIDVATGTLDLADGTSSAPIAIGSGASFLVNSDTYTFATGTTVSGAGTVTLTLGTLSVTGNVSVPNFAQTGGTVDGAGTLTLTGAATWSTGTMQGGGTTEVGATGTFDFLTPSAKTLDNRTFSSVAGGTINLSGNGPINLSNGGNIANAGTLLITTDSTFADGSLGGDIVNTGTIRKQTATGPTTLSGIGLQNNGGLIDLQSGTIGVSSDTFTQAAGSTLKVWLNGTTPGTGFGQLSSTNSVNLAGTLEVALVGLYQPVGGDTFRVVSAPGHVGDFTQPYTYPVLANSRTFSDAYDASGLLLTVNGDADLSISKSAPANVVSGDPIAYTLTVSNAGPDTANGVSVTDVLETGHTSISASGTGWTCNVVTLTVTCTAATLTTGAAPAITINANAPTAPQTFTNVANVSAANDPNNANDSGSAIVTVDPQQADLEMSSFSPASPIAPSTPFSLTFNIKNNGPQTATGVNFSAPIPSTLSYTSATPSTGTCNFAANTVTCSLGSILSAVTENVVVNLSSTTTAGTHTVTGTATALESDSNGTNNSIETPVEVTGSALTVTNTNDSGMGSLREALLDAANGVCTPLPCTIDFNIPGGGPHVIQPVTELPLVQDQTVIDATTQPGYAGAPVVQIDGQSLLTYAFTINGSANTIKGLSITGFTWGIDIHGDNNAIEANYLGLDTLGATAANGDGLRISGNANTVGGTTAAQRNVISGNTSAGVIVEGDVTGNAISGNYIGTDPLGTSARPNTVGVSILEDADSTTVGGPTAAHANVISGNADYGVYVEGGGFVVIAGTPSTNANLAERGLPTGRSAGIVPARSREESGRLEGGAAAGRMPAVRANASGDGILDGTIVRNNWIGPDATGTAALFQGVTGVAIADNAKGTSITDNAISGNNNAITFSGPDVTDTNVSNNLIGVAPDGTTPMGNTQAGVIVVDGTGNTVTANVIANNGGDGVALLGGTKTRIQSNSFFNNTDLGIDLSGDGVTPNDANDADSGPNELQNFPSVASASLIGGGDIHIAYSIDSSGSPSAIGSIGFDIYEADASGEGQTLLLGNNCFAANAFGAGTSFNAPSVAPGDLIVLTATSYTDTSCTNVADGTSEFSNSVVAANCTPPAVTIAGPVQMCAGGSVTLDAGAGFDSYLWSNGATTQTITVSPATTTTYSVTVTDNIGCPNSDSHTVTVNPLPVVAIAGPTATCASTPVTLDAGPGFTSYAWSTGATTQTLTVSPASTTTYTVTVTDGNACSASDSHTVTVTSNPTATITAPAAVCENSTGNAAAVAAQAGASYNWTIANGTITAGQGTNAITFSAGPAGNVTLGVAVTAGTCTSNGNATVPINAPPVVTITGPANVCEGTTVTLDAGAGFTSYLWSNGATTQTIAVIANLTQTHSVTVTSAAGCSATDAHTINVTPAPSAVISAPSPVPANETGLVASVLEQPGATYAWSVTNGAITAGNGTHSIVFNAGASGITKLHVTVTLGGCSDTRTRNVFIEGGTQTDEADLAVTKSAPTSVPTGASLTYTIGIRNFGPAAANIVLTDTLPAGTTFVVMNPGPWSCTRSGATITCNGNAAEGTNSTITITVKAPDRSGILTNTVQITSSTPDPNGANNSASASTSVESQAPECATAPPSLLLPVDLASIPSPATFSWTSVTGATEYELWIEDALEAVTASTSIARSLPSGTFSWFVVARFSNGCDPLASAPRTVTILESNTCATNAAPRILVPSSGNVGSPTTFMWTPVAQAIGYRVWIEVDGTAAQDVGTTSGATSLSVALPPGAIVAYVDALFNGCPATRSTPVQLTVPKPDPCAGRTTALPLSPVDDAVVPSSSVELTWTEASGADGYRVWASLDGAPPAVLGTTTAEPSLKAAIGRGSVVWFVETLHDGCASTESQTRRFTIPARNDCPQDQPSPLSPANGSSMDGAMVQFAWSSVANVVTYELWASVDNGTFALLGTTQSTTLTRTVPAGKIDWFVRAIVDRCGARDSQKFRFTSTLPDACARNDRTHPIAPLSGAIVAAPVAFDWTNVGATKYELFVKRGDAAAQLVATTTVTRVDDVDLAAGKVRWFVRAHFGDGCAPLDSAERRLEIGPQANACSRLAAPVVSAPGQISTGVPLLIQWTPVNGATAYQVLIANNADFDGAAISTVTAPQFLFQGSNDTAAPILRYIRVRAIDARCQPAGISPYGPAHVLLILPKGANGSAPFGTDSIQLEIELGPQYAGQTFTATPKQPWITVSPSSGIVPAGGMTLTVIADADALPIGTSIGSISVAFASSASFSSAARGGIATNDTAIALPLGVSLVTPVTPTPNNTPPPDALIVPAVAHADGINSHFQSDVRVSNTSAQLVTYQLTFTPSGDSGIAQGQQTTFSIEPGRTIALDDILKSWFVTGTGSAIGTLEIRPLTQLATSTQGTAFTGLANLTSFASSRTFNVTSNGTFGQYIPAIPFANFIGSQRVLSLQQIAQSSRYRTNLGIVEGSGEPASLLVRMFGESGQSLGQFPLNLNGGQHVQLNAFLLGQGVDNLTDGRVEVEVVSAGGKVTAYASVLDNETSDPLLVTPVEIDSGGATKWVVPGVADLVSGFANWQTDLRVFNAGAEDVEATVTFYSQNGGTPKTTTITIPAGQVRQFDKALTSLFGASNDGGAVHISTTSPARLIATARTYNQVGAGTYGQFISAVTPNEAAGVNDRPLQLLQVEETDRFRSNIGVVEVTGNPVRLEITAVPPDAKFTAVTEVFLNGNEFRQFGSLLKSMGLTDTHNARVTVRVIDGTGRVTAYASVIDMSTNDPTYVPAQ